MNDDLISPNAWPVNVVIMAGGKGTRLQQFTKSKHKSLMEVAGKPIIRHIADHLSSFGVRELYVSVGHLAEQITGYLGRGDEMGLSIQYLHETAPMGSIGAITLKKDWPYESFLIINGDVFSDFDVSSLVSSFFSESADLAILTAQNNIEIPYGVLDITLDGQVQRFYEKPTYELRINTGIYVFNKKVFRLLPEDQPMEGWQLIQSALSAQCKAIAVPLGSNYWIDIGTIETLEKAQAFEQGKVLE